MQVPVSHPTASVTFPWASETLNETRCTIVLWKKEWGKSLLAVILEIHSTAVARTQCVSSAKTWSYFPNKQIARIWCSRKSMALRKKYKTKDMLSVLEAWGRAKIPLLSTSTRFSWLCMMLWAQEHRTFIFLKLRLNLQDQQFWKILQDCANVIELIEEKKGGTLWDDFSIAFF